MNNNDCSRNNDSNSIGDILKVILILQENACPDKCLDSCDRPMLGGGPNCLICNTRPVQLFTCCGNGVAWSMPTNKDTTTSCSNPQTNSSSDACSSVFRVEKLDGNAATFRVLTKNPEESCCNTQPYIATQSFFTISLDCLCAIRCLNDTFVDCV